MKTFHSVIAGILAFVLFVPTIVSNGLLFPFISGKNFIFRLLVLCACLLFSWVIFKYRKITSVYNPPHIILTFFVGIVLVADLFGVNPARSIFGNFERMEGWFTLGLLYLLFILLYQIHSSIFSWRTVFKVSLIPNVYIILFTFYQYFGGGKISQEQHLLRPDATLGNSSYLGGYALMYIFILAWLTLTSKNIFSKVVYGILIFVNMYVMALTLTRGALVGFSVAIGSIVVMASAVYFFKKIVLLCKTLGHYRDWPLSHLKIQVFVLDSSTGVFRGKVLKNVQFSVGDRKAFCMYSQNISIHA